ncbi:MAG: hypothetical protein SVT56_10510 [Chloroflexota bacterium]|jgi:hypothetical protein|nr:hypothetical protein [Chloroflexota bacterium]
MKINLFLKPLMYLDPGSGSFIIQMLLAGFLGIAVAVRIYWKKIVAFFNRNKGGEVQDELDEMDEYGGSKKDVSSEK